MSKEYYVSIKDNPNYYPRRLSIKEKDNAITIQVEYSHKGDTWSKSENSMSFSMIEADNLANIIKQIVALSNF